MGHYDRQMAIGEMAMADVPPAPQSQRGILPAATTLSRAQAPPRQSAACRASGAGGSAADAIMGTDTRAPSRVTTRLR